MIKKLSFLLATFLITTGAFAQQKFSINGKIDDLKEPSIVLLEYKNGSDYVDDSVVLKNGKFKFSGTVDRPVKATLMVRPLNIEEPISYEMRKSFDKRDFYLGKKKIVLKGTNLENAEIKAGKTQDEYLLLRSQVKPLEDESWSIFTKIQMAMKDGDEASRKELLPKLHAINEKMKKAERDFLSSHPDSYVTFDIVIDKAIIIEPEIFEPYFDLLSPRFKNTAIGQEMKERLEIAKRTSIGQPAIDFTQETVNGQSVTLSSFRGKYVLLDFWASWCGPCRAENPNVLKVYEAYKDKNFDVLAVSLDEERDSWIKAIKDDGMPWTQVSDLKGFNNAAAVLYGIKAIPQNFLINPEGEIVATNLRGDKLKKTLEELIK